MLSIIENHCRSQIYLTAPGIFSAYSQVSIPSETALLYCFFLVLKKIFCLIVAARRVPSKRHWLEFTTKQLFCIFYQNSAPAAGTISSLPEGRLKILSSLIVKIQLYGIHNIFIKKGERKDLSYYYNSWKIIFCVFCTTSWKPDKIKTVFKKAG